MIKNITPEGRFKDINKLKLGVEYDYLALGQCLQYQAIIEYFVPGRNRNIDITISYSFDDGIAVNTLLMITRTVEAVITILVLIINDNKEIPFRS